MTSPKCLTLSTKLHSVISQNTVFVITISDAETCTVFGLWVHSFAQYRRQLLQQYVIAGQYKQPLQALPYSHAPYSQKYKSFTCTNRFTYLLVLESTKIYIKIHTKLMKILVLSKIN
jgi:hypothetical protein